MRQFFITMIVLLATTVASAALESRVGPLKVDRVVSGLEAPWSMGFLPGGGFLVTERDGNLRHFREDGTQSNITGLPDIAAAGQGGLLDVLIPRNFA
ncbi:MAG: PQQ-dependent sugar dehydrogenase, partial [Pseudomonadota bacterium]